MDALAAALSEGGIGAWLTMAVIIIVGIVILRIVFEVASVIIRIGCLVIFIAVIAYLLFSIFGGA